ncbi:MAG: hypothetical protein B6U95_02970 [Thermofilum sp. ex4484_82]|nr:MAG: hypothetical protein B6U95_02970 [Thermofilum sp. ex4484_82]OYT39000.1 MAG: hypothetical protein B6U96_02965 [Archaeoglobales archaeon ex4484_92]RLE76971.1 MAG: hypothetical protein DRZ80_00060 [Thermoprotei archaeon]
MRKLTKEDILKGKDKRVELYIPEYDAAVVIRPLTDGELTEILSMLENLPLREDGTPALEKIDLQTNLKLLKLAASKGLVEPQLTLNDLEQMKFGVPEYIGMKVLEISGLVPPEEAEKKS